MSSFQNWNRVFISLFYEKKSELHDINSHACMHDMYWNDSVSVEELVEVLILAEHLWCDFKWRRWAKNSSPNQWRIQGVARDGCDHHWSKLGHPAQNLKPPAHQSWALTNTPRHIRQRTRFLWFVMISCHYRDGKIFPRGKDSTVIMNLKHLIVIIETQ